MIASRALAADGFAMAARQAWDCRQPGDPEIAAWLAASDFFGETRHGFNFLAPKLHRHWCRSGGVPATIAGRFRGLLRHRAAANAARMRLLAEAVTALRQDGGGVLVTGGWSDVLGGTPLHEASLLSTDLAVAPFDGGRVARIMGALGWARQGGRWGRPVVSQGAGSMRVFLSVEPRLAIGGAIVPDATTHLAREDALIAQAVDLAGGRAAPWLARQQLDRLESLVAETADLAAIVARARGHGVEQPCRAGLRLLPQVAGSGFPQISGLPPAPGFLTRLRHRLALEEAV